MTNPVEDPGTDESTYWTPDSSTKDEPNPRDEEVADGLPDYWDGVTDVVHLRMEVRRFRDDATLTAEHLWKTFAAAVGSDDHPQQLLAEGEMPWDCVERMRNETFKEVARLTRDSNGLSRAVEAQAQLIASLDKQRMDLADANDILRASNNMFKSMLGGPKMAGAYRAEIKRLGDYLLKEFPDAVGVHDNPADGGESAVDVAIRLLGLAKLMADTATKLASDIIPSIYSVLKQNGVIK